MIKGLNKKNMDAIITVQLKMHNVCCKEDLDNNNMTLQDMCQYLIKEGGLIGVVDIDDYEIVEVKEYHNITSS